MTKIEARFRGRLGEFELDAAFTAPGRGVTALFGPSGCGKTTLLRCVAGLQRLDGGFLRVGPRPWQDGAVFLPPHKRPIGYVFQEASLFAHLSVKGNLTYGFKRRDRGFKQRDRGINRRDRRDPSQARGPDFDHVVALLGLDALLDRSPRRLSGGERQRVAIGRALLSGPEVLLMDEPLAALDRASKHEILPYLERLHDDLAIPALYVSHDIAEIERLADHMVLMEAGRVRAMGPLTALLADPELPLARMPDAATVFEGRVVAHDHAYGLSTLAVPGGTLIVPGGHGAAHACLRVRVSASDVGLCRSRSAEGSSILNGPIARIVAAEAMGAIQMNVFMRLGAEGEGARLLARITRKSWDMLGLQVGETVHALIKSVALVEEAIPRDAVGEGEPAGP